MNYTFSIENAKKYGVDEAIFLENLLFWIKQNRANGRNFIDGYYWTYNSVTAFQELFPFWSKPQLRRIIDKLEKEKVIKAGEFNESSYDRTKWYTVINKEINSNYNTNKKLKKKQTDKPISETRGDEKDFSTITDINKTNVNNNVVVKPTSDHKLIVDEYHELYKLRYNIKPTFGGQQGKIIQNLLKQYPCDDLVNWLQAYLNSDDPFWVKAGHSLNVFVSSLDSIRTGSYKKKASKGMAMSKTEQLKQMGFFDKKGDTE